MEKLLERFQIFFSSFTKRKSIGDEMILSVNRGGEVLELTMILEERPQIEFLQN